MTEQGTRSSRPVTTIGVLGAGRVGTAIARRSLASGHRVLIAASGSASDIELLVDIVAPGAHARATAGVAEEADLVVLALPFHKHRTLNPDLLAGHLVVDAMNHWAPIDGTIPEIDDNSRGTSEIVQAYLQDATLVKTFNHIGYHEIESDGLPTGSPGRRALALAGDDADARLRVADVVDRLGFDPVDAGPLSAGRLLEPSTPIFNGTFTRRELIDALSIRP